MLIKSEEMFYPGILANEEYLERADAIASEYAQRLARCNEDFSKGNPDIFNNGITYGLAIALEIMGVTRDTRDKYVIEAIKKQNEINDILRNMPHDHCPFCAWGGIPGEQCPASNAICNYDPEEKCTCCAYGDEK